MGFGDSRWELWYYKISKSTSNSGSKSNGNSNGNSNSNVTRWFGVLRLEAWCLDRAV